MINHILQSTLFACAVALLMPMLRKNRAAVRHALWVTASMKFLVPFSLLIALGNQVEWRKAAAIAPIDVVLEVHDTITIAPTPHATHPPQSHLPSILFCIWSLGFVANCFAWWRRWREIRAIERAASPMPLNLPVPVLSSASTLEPGVIGILRPVILLPDRLQAHVTPDQFDAILAHELCHVERRDTLWSAIHMVVEALFWFNPAVWWIRSRMIEERERACDEAVLLRGNDPQTYALGIVAVCELYLQSPLPCVSGVTGSNLKRRVETIMRNRPVDRLSVGRAFLLAAAGAVVLAAPLALGAFAQEPAKPVPQLIATSSLPEFEVASIKPSAPDSALRVDFAPGGKLYVSNATLRFLIKIAYDIGDDQLATPRSWISSKRFDLAATPDKAVGGDPKNMAPDQILTFHKPTRLRLQRLLADRFQLELRRESAPMPIFALVLANGGPKLTPSKSTGDPKLTGKLGSGVLSATGVDMATLARFLSEGQTGRIVVDRTGLTGKFDFKLEWTPDPNLSAAPSDNTQPADTGGVSIFTAVQQQLGLKLEAHTGAADRLVVVRAELPSSN